MSLRGNECHLKRFAMAEFFLGVPKCLRSTLNGAETISIDEQTPERVIEAFEESQIVAMRQSGGYPPYPRTQERQLPKIRFGQIPRGPVHTSRTRRTPGHPYEVQSPTLKTIEWTT